MPRYFFQIRDGREIRDEEGMELADAGKARVEALRLAGSLLHNLKTAFWMGDGWAIDVTDRAGEVLLTVRVQISPGVDAKAV